MRNSVTRRVDGGSALKGLCERTMSAGCLVGSHAYGPSSFGAAAAAWISTVRITLVFNSNTLFVLSGLSGLSGLSLLFLFILYFSFFFSFSFFSRRTSRSTFARLPILSPSSIA